MSHAEENMLENGAQVNIATGYSYVTILTAVYLITRIDLDLPSILEDDRSFSRYRN